MAGPDTVKLWPQGGSRVLQLRRMAVDAQIAPQAAAGWGARATAGIRSGYGCRKADGSMEPRRAAVVLLVLLLTDGGCAGGPGDESEDQIFMEEDSGAHPLQEVQTPGSFLRSLLQAMQRPGRSPTFLFQPQRFGRNAWGSWNSKQLSPRAGEGFSSPFWSLAAPQRFGKK